MVFSFVNTAQYYTTKRLDSFESFCVARVSNQVVSLYLLKHDSKIYSHFLLVYAITVFTQPSGYMIKLSCNSYSSLK